jgi:hypothetical protein
MKLRFVPPRLHGVLDFVTAGLLAAGPEVFQVRDASASTMPARLFGLGVFPLSILTDYGPTKDRFELGGPRLIPLKTHLVIDALSGIAVGLAPWVGGTWRKGWNYWAPQALVMSSELFFALTTKTDTRDD